MLECSLPGTSPESREWWGTGLLDSPSLCLSLGLWSQPHSRINQHFSVTATFLQPRLTVSCQQPAPACAILRTPRHLPLMTTYHPRLLRIKKQFYVARMYHGLGTLSTGREWRQQGSDFLYNSAATNPDFTVPSRACGWAMWQRRMLYYVYIVLWTLGKCAYR